MTEKFAAGKEDQGEPFYSCIDMREATDEEVLSLYAIYRDPDEGQTLEPYETMFQDRHAVSESNDEGRKHAA
jgi:hypothetical protein